MSELFMARKASPTIREIAPAFDSPWCVGATLQGRMCVWSLADGSLVSTFASLYDYGGRRICVAPDADVCLVGAYSPGTITCHRIPSGRAMWRRTDVPGVQYLSFDTWRRCWVACWENGTCELLEINTGELRKRLRGIRARVTSPYDRVVFVDTYGGRRLELRNAETDLLIARIERRSPAVLDVTYAPGRVVVAEMTVAMTRMRSDGSYAFTGKYDPPGGGPVRAIAISKGELLWECQPGEGRHFVRLAYGRSSRKLYGILGSERGNAVVCALVVIEVETGRLADTGVLHGDTREVEFAFAGEGLVTSGGEVYDLATAVPRRRTLLELPQ